MTITPFEIYLIALADKVSTVTEFMAIFSGIAFIAMAVVFLVSNSIEENQNDKGFLNFKKYTLLVALFFCINITLTTVTPKTKTLAAMYLVPAIVNNEQIQNSADNSLKLLEKLTREWLEDFIKKDDKPTERKETSI